MSNGYDVAQICLNGHKINAFTQKYPQHNSDFCSKCGKETISVCLSCNEHIRGGYLGLGGSFDLPSFCHHCGTPYPWTTARMEALKELADEVDEFSDDDREKFRSSIDTVITDNPRTEIAATRMKMLYLKVRDTAGPAIRSFMVDAASETAKKIFLGD
ncbi:MAG: DUF2321 domain-containing protein [Spirochaetales bacterium]|jgi:hypothetical protein|nr:DUF2321 domain-containing protein [Spirochaetales bacterium]